MRILLGILFILILTYLMVWPTPVEPRAWEAPQSQGLTGDFAPNERLAGVETISIAPHFGPEDICKDADGQLITVSKDGSLLRIDEAGIPTVLARLGGRPLGIELDQDGTIVVANAGVGLQRVTSDGRVSILARKFAGAPIRYADDVAIGSDGIIYFSDATSRFDPRKFGTLAASELDILEHDPTGRILAYDPRTSQIQLLMDKLAFANGVAIDPNGEFLLVAETGKYRILRHWLVGPRKGQTEVILENLPGFPDNINTGNEGRYWVGLVSPRVSFLDKFSDSPFIRKMASRLPAAIKPKATPSSHLLAISSNGEVLLSLQSSHGPVHYITGAFEDEQYVHLTNLKGELMGKLAKNTLGL